jgi:hypothetical protein
MIKWSCLNRTIYNFTSGATDMDKNFLEFWGNFMLSAAKGQKQMEDMSKWMNSGFTGTNQISEMFCKAYGLTPSTPNKKEQMHFPKETVKEFYKSFEMFLSLFDLIPKKKYLELEKKYEELKKEMKDREETADQFKIFMDGKKDQQKSTLNALNDIIVQQTSHFQKMMSEFTPIKTETESKAKAKPKTAAKPKAKPKTATKPKAKPKAKTKPKTAAKPKAEKK